MCTKSVMSSWCVYFFFFIRDLTLLHWSPGEVTTGPTDTSDSPTETLGELSGDTCSAVLKTWTKSQKVQASSVNSFDAMPLPRSIRGKDWMLMQLHDPFFNFHSCVLWQMSDSGLIFLGINGFDVVAGRVLDVGRDTQWQCIRISIMFQQKGHLVTVSVEEFFLCQRDQN